MCIKVVWSKIVLEVGQKLYENGFFEDKELPRETNRDLWNQTVNKDVAEVDAADQDSEKARYLSTMEPLIAEFETKSERVWIARSNAAMDVWFGHIATFLDVGKSPIFRTALTATSGRFFTGSGMDA